MTARWIFVISLAGLFAAPGSAEMRAAAAPQAPTQAQAAYPDSPAGLQQLVEDLLGAIKANDSAKADSLWGSAILPDHAAWFSAVFGEKAGASLESNYAKLLAVTPYGPGKAYTFTAGLDAVKILVLPLAQAAVSRPDSWARAIQLSMKDEVHAYRVEALSAGSASSVMLGFSSMCRAASGKRTNSSSVRCPPPRAQRGCLIFLLVRRK